MHFHTTVVIVHGLQLVLIFSALNDSGCSFLEYDSFLDGEREAQRSGPDRLNREILGAHLCLLRL